MKKTFLLIIILLFFLIPEGIAQYGFRKGFVIASEKDTIYGELDYRSNLSNNKSCLFRKGSVVTEYKPSQILGYGFTGGRYFTSQIIKGTFVEVLVKGELSLFKSGFDLYVQKINNEPLRLESKIIRETVETKVEGERNESVVYREDVRWKGLLSALTSDCIESSNAIQVLKLDEKNLTRFVIDYNLCKGSGYTDYKSKLPWTKFEYGITAGLAVSSIKTKNKPYNFEYLDDIYQSVNPTFGVQLVVSSPRIYEKIVLETGLYYIKSSRTGSSARPFSVSAYSTAIGLSGSTRRSTIPACSKSFSRSESILSLITSAQSASSLKRSGRSTSARMIVPARRPSVELWV